MRKTFKVQVTLEEDHFRRLEEVARRDGKKLAAVVREAVIRYCVEPEQARQKLEAIEALAGVEAPVPADYRDWEEVYSRRKRESGSATASQDSATASQSSAPSSLRSGPSRHYSDPLPDTPDPGSSDGD